MKENTVEIERSALRWPRGLAFVVQFEEGSDPTFGPVRGRVEHVESGRDAHFSTADQLFGFMGREVGRERDECGIEE